MPSIPQSLLWISLVVLWLFVLVPMLINKRDAVRRTSDVALAARVLTSGAGARLLKRGGPAAGHRSDPHWRHAADADSVDTADAAEAEAAEAEGSPVRRAVMVMVPAEERVESDYLDVDVVDEDSGALPVGAGLGNSAGTEPADTGSPADRETGGESQHRAEDADDVESSPGAATDAGTEADAGTETDADAGEFEYVEDTSGLEPEADSPIDMAAFAGASRRRRYDSSTATAVIARKYAFRKRVLTVLAAIMVVTATMAFTVTSTAWWFCGIATGVTVLYLAYLRRQTRIEEQVRARRIRRLARSRPRTQQPADQGVDPVSSRLHRPGAAVLEVDDEDPAFEHLEYASFARDYDWRRDLPRAAGQ